MVGGVGGGSLNKTEPYSIPSSHLPAVACVFAHTPAPHPPRSPITLTHHAHPPRSPVTLTHHTHPSRSPLTHHAHPSRSPTTLTHHAHPSRSLTTLTQHAHPSPHHSRRSTTFFSVTFLLVFILLYIHTCLVCLEVSLIASQWQLSLY